MRQSLPLIETAARPNLKAPTQSHFEGIIIRPEVSAQLILPWRHTENKVSLATVSAYKPKASAAYRAARTENRTRLRVVTVFLHSDSAG
jgi:hypothetical protein